MFYLVANKYGKRLPIIWTNKDIPSFSTNAVYVIINNVHLKQIYKSILVSFQR